MRSGRAVLFGLAAVLMVAVAAAGGVLFNRGWRTAAGEEQTPAETTDGTTPLGQFIPAAAPQSAPQVSLTDTGGKIVSLADFNGKVVLLNLWATWCAPCRREMPSLERLQTRFGDKIAVLAISEDFGGNKVVAPFVAKLGLSAIKIYLDPKSAVGKAFKVDGLPTSFVIDRHGRVRGKVEGEADWNAPKMRAAIASLLRRDSIVKASYPQTHP